MHRAIKAADKLSDRKYRAYCRRLHLKRLKNVKPSIDNRPPKRCPHLRQNLKKKQLMEERFATIERENQLLLEKMSAIMNKNCLDNKNHSLKYAHSMNKGRRELFSFSRFALSKIHGSPDHSIDSAFHPSIGFWSKIGIRWLAIIHFREPLESSRRSNGLHS